MVKGEEIMKVYFDLFRLCSTLVNHALPTDVSPVILALLSYDINTYILGQILQRIYSLPSAYLEIISLNMREKYVFLSSWITELHYR